MTPACAPVEWAFTALIFALALAALAMTLVMVAREIADWWNGR